MGLFKREKREELGFDLQNPINQNSLIQASLDNKVPLFNKGHGVFIVDIKHTKEKNLRKFMQQFIADSINCQQGIIDRDNPRINYILIYDKEV